MKFSYWRFTTDLTHLFILTPLFLLYISNGAKDFYSYTLWWGFEFWWRRNKKIKEGDWLFLRSIKHVSDRITF